MSGLVSLVGAGPGDPELITVLGARRLQEADAVVYDRLVDPRLWAGLSAELIDVGKAVGHQPMPQAKINTLLVRLAQAGRRVVRLKAGDPYVFGRGGEEALFLQEHDVAYEVVPGVTSAIAGLAAGGIPITHRGLATSFHVITGHTKDGRALDWATLAKLEGTLVFLMGMAALSKIQQELLRHGKPASTPAAVIQSATHWQQQQVSSDLGHIAAAATALKPPAVIVIGAVAALAPRLAQRLPLAGSALLVPATAVTLQHRLHDAGAAVATYTAQQVPHVFAHAVLVTTSAEVTALAPRKTWVALNEQAASAAEAAGGRVYVSAGNIVEVVARCIQ